MKVTNPPDQVSNKVYSMKKQAWEETVLIHTIYDDALQEIF